MRQAIISAFLGRLRDRFCEYQEPLTIAEKLATMAKIPDPSIRRKAIDIIKSGKDYAHAIGVGQVTCCPLSDGYDYSFHTHYVRAWERMVDAVREAAAHRPEVTLLMEYKPSETRVHCLLDSAAKALLLCHAVGQDHVGVTIDVGHSIYGGETPAEALAQVAMSAGVGPADK